MLAGLFALGALLLVPFVTSQAGGFGALFTSRSEFNSALQAQGLEVSNNATRALIKSVPSSFATSAVVLSLWLVRTSPRGHPMRLRAGTVAIVTTLLLFVVANPFVYSRYIVLATFGTVAMTFFWPRGRKAALVWLLGLLMAFLLVYPAADLFRGQTGGGRTGRCWPARTSTASNRPSTPSLTSTRTASPTAAISSRDCCSSSPEPSGPPRRSPLRSRWPKVSLHLPDLSEPARPRPLSIWVGLASSASSRSSVSASPLSTGLAVPQSGFVIAAYLAVAQVGLWRGPLGSLAPVFGFTIVLLLLAIALSRVGIKADPATP